MSAAPAAADIPSTWTTVYAQGPRPGATQAHACSQAGRSAQTWRRSSAGAAPRRPVLREQRAASRQPGRPQLLALAPRAQCGLANDRANATSVS